MRRLHQFVPTLEPGAVASHMLEVQKLFISKGWQSEIFCHHNKFPEIVARPYKDYAKPDVPRPDDILLYQIAIGSPIAEFLIEQPQKLVVNHHNLTPIEYFEPWDPLTTYGVQWGEEQLRALALKAELGIAVSSFNEAELKKAGFSKTTVVPVLVDVSSISPMSVVKSNEKGKSWLFVGRVAPHKCQHDVIKAFALYRETYDRDALLHLVGGSSSPTYTTALKDFVSSIDSSPGLAEAVRFHGSVSGQELDALYQQADVFVCLSEHEGFCVPLLEAMSYDVPIVAFAAGAVPETLEDAGMLLRSKDPALVAAVTNRVCSRDDLRSEILKRQRKRLADFDLNRVGNSMFEAITSIV